ncbi:YhcN/YlaJ family sporulation lipoprotein [Sediminibacillus albus]|uniref:Sporulation lipoprotein YhcN/YlaJ (Spore_YhcN_YlaJ) n=1 Tax=Sediminibacillus albus TaxID=407036 RepID=A0A1G8YXI8_9BACI|nr:YhcN/YlaJ family sporulation lipoprotein [Sediminibacillus albus]SDK07579.1 Sporulation lipoprotein YhcN/YlaJ (Spore_YhcN_YlaJ) [Sediminibacillus albus]
MKAKFTPWLLACILTVSGCATGENLGTNPDRSLNGNSQIDEQAPASLEADDDATSRLGYVRYKKDELDPDLENRQMASINRNKMADTITRMILRYDGFEEAATLVTDDEVLIAYQRPGDMDREKAASIAKKTAMSVMPRYFNIIVSDQPTAFSEIQSLQNSSTRDQEYNGTLRSIIANMKGAPQGDNWPDADVEDKQEEALMNE